METAPSRKKGDERVNTYVTQGKGIIDAIVDFFSNFAKDKLHDKIDAKAEEAKNKKAINAG